MEGNEIKSKQQQIYPLIIIIYFSFDHVDITNLYETNGFAYQLYTPSFETNSSDCLRNVLNSCVAEKYANELKRIHDPIIILKIIEGIFLIKEYCIFDILPVK
ncbi:hypothetical protein ABE15_34275 [Bacillus cereus]|nr:hypothetical protein [Bacillus cereus]